MSIVVLPPDRHPSGYDELGEGLGDGEEELGLGDGEGFGDGEGLTDGDGAGPVDGAGDGFLAAGGVRPPRAGLLAGPGDCDGLGLAMVLGEGGPAECRLATAGFPLCGWFATVRAACVPVIAIRAAVTAATAHTATAATTVAVPTLARILLQPTSVPSRRTPVRPVDRARLTRPCPDGEAVLTAERSSSCSRTSAGSVSSGDTSGVTCSSRALPDAAAAASSACESTLIPVVRASRRHSALAAA